MYLQKLNVGIEEILCLICIEILIWICIYTVHNVVFLLWVFTRNMIQEYVIIVFAWLKVSIFCVYGMIKGVLMAFLM